MVSIKSAMPQKKNSQSHQKREITVFIRPHLFYLPITFIACSKYYLLVELFENITWLIFHTDANTCNLKWNSIVTHSVEHSKKNSHHCKNNACNLQLLPVKQL